MKKIKHTRMCSLLIGCTSAFLILLSACEKEKVAPPVISEIRNYAASPADTVLQTLAVDQWVVVLGRNLGDVSQVYFGTRPATLNHTLLTDQSIVVKVPAIPFDSVATNKLNTVTVVNSSGSASYTIHITGPPVITRVRNYAAPPDDTVLNKISPSQKISIIGYNLKKATAITFQGVEADLTGAVYTDSSVVVKVPGSFAGADPALTNKITYTTSLGTATFSIRIF